MFSKYKPTWLVTSIYQIDPEQLKKVGIKAVLTDLDNTLIAWNDPDGTKELHEWLIKMENAQIPVVVVSNNSAKRIDRALRNLSLDSIARALKPFSFGIKRAYKKLNLKKEEVVMVGDQLMTDIRAANSAGVRSILVQPIVATDSWKTRINRFFERRVMKHLLKKDPAMIKRGELE